MAVPSAFREHLTLPVIVAPMFVMSGPELIISACSAGLAAALPALNARTTAELDQWLCGVEAGLQDVLRKGPHGVNLIVHRSSRRLDADLAVVARHRVPFVVTSVGNPKPVVDAVHSYGGTVLHDATTLPFVERAIDSGVDGVVLVCNGAGGHAGTMNPFAFLPQVRNIYDGTVVLAGAISDGRAIRAALLLGADLVYMGTRFNATVESRAPIPFKEMLVTSTAIDLIYTAAFTGIPANMLKPSIRAAGLDPERLDERADIDLGKDLDSQGPLWSRICSAGQGVGSIDRILPVSELTRRLKAEFLGARHLERLDWDAGSVHEPSIPMGSV